jgi:aspartyl-tRNA(Asn)/glutamyl-tRNA(Gln) amidotransferase subunit A
VDELIALGVTEAAALIARREVSATELTTACLDRIRDVDGAHSHDGDPESINAWVRVYEEDAIAAAAGADEILATGGDLPPLLGVPIGLKDLYGVAGKPVTASSSLLNDVPSEDCAVWQRLAAAGMILVGHLHTHEFAAGGTTDQVGNPWDLARSAGGSSGGSAAALSARMVPAATGSDTAGSLRIPSACCGTSTIKPTRGLVSTSGVVPLSWTLDHAGPMARSLADCRALLAAIAGPDRGRAESALNVGLTADQRGTTSTFEGARIAVSPRLASVALDGDVAAGFERAIEACRELGATVIEPPAPDCGFEIADAFHDVMTTDMLAYHRRFDGSRERYRPALRQWLEMGEQRAVSGERYASLQAGRRVMTAAWSDWLVEHRIAAVVEPTIPVVAPPRGDGYEQAGSDYVLISLTHFWNWTGFPVVTLPSGVGQASRLPVSVSLVGAGGADQQLLDLGIRLQTELGAPDWP